MNTFSKFPLAFYALVSATLMTQPTHARTHHIWFDDSFWDTSWVDQVREFQHQAMEEMKQHMANFGPSKEDQEAIKAAREAMAKVTYELKEDDQKVTITITGFDTLNQKDVKVVKKKKCWVGTIPMKSGIVEFVIGPNGFRLDRRIEIKKEEKGKDKEGKETKNTRLFYEGSLASEGEYFKNHVDIKTLKAEPIKNNTLTLTVQKEKEEVLSIP